MSHASVATIKWCDPYIESPSGGVDGTTGVGTLGSYTNPYSINNLPTTSYVNGDEIRLKALPSNPWVYDYRLQWSANLQSYGVRFFYAPDQHSFIKYTSIKGDKTYLSWSDYNRTYTQSSPTTWQSSSHFADTTLPAYKLDPQYYLSNLVNTAKNYLIQGQYNIQVTLTAGWVSETARGGETIIHRVGSTQRDERWFGYNYSMPMIVDAPELTISRSTTLSSMDLKIYGKTVEVHDIIERSGYGSSCDVQIWTSETLKANSVVCPAYIKMYSPYYDTPATQGVNRDIKHIMCGYYCYVYNQGAASAVNRIKFKNLSIRTFMLYAALDLSYYDDFYFYVGNMAGNFDATEQGLDPAVNKATVFPHSDRMGSIGPALQSSLNSAYRNNNRETIKTFGGYLTPGANINTRDGDIYFRDLLLPVGETLENVTSHNVKSSYSSNYYNFHGKAWGVDRNSGRRIAFAVAEDAGNEMMMMYNSTEYSNKLVYHLMPNPNYGRCFDRVYLDMPTGVSEIAATTNYRIKYTLGGAVSAPVVLSLELEGNSISSVWGTSQAYNTFISPAAGGEGTVVYSNTFNSGSTNDTFNTVGSQQLLGILNLSYQAANPTGVAKICLDSIEIEVV